MKNIITLLITLTFLSCQKSAISEIEDCNRVEFYRISEKNQTMAWRDTINNKQIVQDILTNDKKLNLNNPEIISVLNKDYTKYNVDEESSEDIIDEFTGWKIPEIEIFDQACAPTYRDILIFKKDNKIMGFAKVCFQCSQNYISVNNLNGKDVSIDYEDLKDILDELASS